MRARAAAAAFLAAAGLTLACWGLWIPAKAALAQVLLDRAFDQSLKTGAAVRPWPWADTWPSARVSVPRLGRSAIVLEGASGQALAFGPGHLRASPEPGELGTAVYAAHRDTHFAFLGELQPGDLIEVTRRDGRTLRFTVTGARVARWNASGIDPRASGRQLALTTCWPFGALAHGPWRYVVTAKLSGPPSRRR